MARLNLNQFRDIRRLIVGARIAYLRAVVGMRIGSRVSISLASRFIPSRRGAITIGNETLIAFKTLLYTWDDRAGRHRPISVGDRCFVGGGSVILPGVTIGDGSIVGAGSVVFEDVPPATIVGGNPARVLRTGIEVEFWGRLKLDVQAEGG